jgi:hypothetical protein
LGFAFHSLTPSVPLLNTVTLLLDFCAGYMLGFYVSSRRSILKASEGFRAAEVLADFANLNPADEAAVGYFRHNWGDFAPVAWWDYLHRSDGNRVYRFEDIIAIGKNDPDWERKFESKALKQWQHTQNEVRKAWTAGFKFKTTSDVSDLLKLIFYVESPGVPWNSSQVYVPGKGLYELHSELQVFHKGVLYLQEHPRHAKICEECGKFFVSAHGKRTLCPYPDLRGETCGQKRINRNKLKWWNERGTKQRKAKSKRKKSNRGAQNNA